MPQQGIKPAPQACALTGREPNQQPFHVQDDTLATWARATYLILIDL